jgi:hypothetical protein
MLCVLLDILNIIGSVNMTRWATLTIVNNNADVYLASFRFLYDTLLIFYMIPYMIFYVLLYRMINIIDRKMMLKSVCLPTG